MHRQNWFILIYRTADAASQEHLADGLRSLGNMVVDTEQDAGDHFVVVECQDTTPALTLHELVMAIDAGATLVDTHGKVSNGRDTDINFGHRPAQPVSS